MTDDAEIAALKIISAEFEKIADAAARVRMLNWLLDKYWETPPRKKPIVK